MKSRNLIELEKFTFILNHEYIFEDGHKIPISDPIVFTFVNAYPQKGISGFFVNEMLEQYKEGLYTYFRTKFMEGGDIDE